MHDPVTEQVDLQVGLKELGLALADSRTACDWQEEGFSAFVVTAVKEKSLCYLKAAEFLVNALYSGGVHKSEGFFSWMCKSLTEQYVWSVVSLHFK